MKTSDLDILFAPGLGGPDPDHWQSRWAARLSTARIVKQEDWSAPRREAWVDTLRDEVGSATRPVLLVGHSLGAHAIAHAARSFSPGKVVGAMLVAPPSDAALRAIAAQTETPADFTPTARERLPFPTLLVASRTDPYAPYAFAEELGVAWGARMLDAGEAGHIDAASGHGPWPEGLMTFAGFLKSL